MNKTSPVIFCVWFLLLPFLSGCDPSRYTLRGNVYHHTNGIHTPVANANINLDCQKLKNKNTNSDSNGNFLIVGIGFIDDANCSIHVEHSDFKEKTVIIDSMHLEGEKNLHPNYNVQVNLDN